MQEHQISVAVKAEKNTKKQIGKIEFLYRQIILVLYNKIREACKWKCRTLKQEDISMKKKLAIILSAACVLGSTITASAGTQYDYEMKYLYEQNFDCLWLENPTFGELVAFQSSNDFNLYNFVNSAWGEQTAKNFYTYITYAKDPMNPNLVAYWKRQGLLKESYRDLSSETETDTEQESPDENGIIGNYFVYSPIRPEADPNTKYPCIIVNHGGNEPAFQAESFGYCQIAAREGIILIMAENNDAENLYQILEKVKQEYPVDETRIYGAGSSKGSANTMIFSAEYPNLLAAITTLDVPPKYLTEEETENYQAVKEGKLPLFDLAGLADKMLAYPMNTNAKNNISLWNTLMTVTNHEDYCLTDEETSDLAQNSLNVIEHLTGGRFESTRIEYPTNNEVFINDFTNENGITDLRIVVVENRGHIPSGYDAEYSWDFMKHFSRDTETGESIYTE